MTSLNGSKVAETSSSVASRLWVHLQKNLANKSTTPLQACVSFGTHAIRAGSDHMLAEWEQQLSRQHLPLVRTTPELGDSNGPLEDPHSSFTLPAERSAPSILFDEEILVSNDDTVTGEVQDNFLLDTIPHEPGSTVHYLCEKQRDTQYLSDYPMWTSSASLPEPSLQESHRSLGTAHSEPPSGGRLMFAEPNFLHEESLFEERKEHDVESAEDLLLAF
jgi:hypothetical protein